MGQIYEQHKENNERQLHLIEEQIQADAEKRKQKLTEITQLQQQWKPIVTGLQQAKAILSQLEQNKAL